MDTRNSEDEKRAREIVSRFMSDEIEHEDDLAVEIAKALQAARAEQAESDIQMLNQWVLKRGTIDGTYEIAAAIREAFKSKQ